MVRFENTTTKVEVIKWYSITDAPAMSAGLVSGVQVVPTTARFTFEDGECKILHLHGRKVRKDGSVGDQVQQVVDIYIWNETNWPDWLHELYKIARREYASYYTSLPVA